MAPPRLSAVVRGRLLTGAVAAGLVFSPAAALAHHQPMTGETCRAFRYEETYVPGYTNGNGRWVKGGIQLRKERIACAPGGYGVAHAPHHYGHPAPYPVPYPQQQQQAGQPIVVNGPAPQRCGGTLARMGLGGILGGVAGRYAVGGRKSNKTILGTSIGAAAGALIGRATC